jgi:hypothetical protein
MRDQRLGVSYDFKAMVYLDRLGANDESYDGTKVLVSYQSEAGYDGGRDEPSYDSTVEVTEVIDAETGERYYDEDLSDEDIAELTRMAEKIEAGRNDVDGSYDGPEVHKYYSTESVQRKDSAFVAELNRLKKLAGL